MCVCVFASSCIFLCYFCWYICSLKHNKMGWFVQQQNLHNMINVLENRGCLRILHMQIKEASMKQQKLFKTVFSAVTAATTTTKYTRNNKRSFQLKKKKKLKMGQKRETEWKLIAKTYYWLIYYTLYTEKSCTIYPFFTELLWGVGETF